MDDFFSAMHQEGMDTSYRASKRPRGEEEHTRPTDQGGKPDSSHQHRKGRGKTGKGRSKGQRFTPSWGDDSWGDEGDSWGPRDPDRDILLSLAKLSLRNAEDTRMLLAAHSWLVKIEVPEAKTAVHQARMHWKNTLPEGGGRHPVAELHFISFCALIRLGIPRDEATPASKALSTLAAKGPSAVRAFSPLWKGAVSRPPPADSPWLFKLLFSAKGSEHHEVANIFFQCVRDNLFAFFGSVEEDAPPEGYHARQVRNWTSSQRWN
jgi:hypothetical protein